MPAPPPAFYPVNVLDGATWGMIPDGPVSGQDVARLADRDIGLEVEDQATTGDRMWFADRGVGAPATLVSVWILVGSNIAGIPFRLDSSPDQIAWTTRGTITPAANGATRVPVTVFAVPRWVRLVTTNPSVPVRLTECVLAPALTFKWKPAAGTLREPQLLNVNTVNSVSGRGWGVQRGPRRWSSSFTMTNAPNTDKARMLELLDDLADTAKPFFVLTVSGDLRWVRLVPPIDASGVSKSPTGEWDLPVSLVEELP